MCGILGQLTFKAPRPTVLQLSAIAHRGPDGNAEWTNKNGNVGHVRLAILDRTSTGAQPMSDSTRRLTITFNDEIYNHLNLRPMLPNVAWRSTSDMETLIELFAVEGFECFQYLKGMFLIPMLLRDSDQMSMTSVNKSKINLERSGIRGLIDHSKTGSP
jgi:asparagine synthase (glutamine-hydrolysing)